MPAGKNFPSIEVIPGANHSEALKRAVWTSCRSQEGFDD